jgi:hypothetical protein
MSQKYSEEDRQRVLAIIAHIKNGGGKIYDNAPGHVFTTKKTCPPEYQEYENKNSQQLLNDYENLLRKIEEDLN